MSKGNIVAGLSVKRPGPVEYSSDSHHCSAELVDVEIKNADHFRAVTQALFAEVKAALEAEVAGAPSRADGERPVDLWNAGGNGNSRKPVARPAEARPRADRMSADPISNKQAKYLFQLARRAGLKTQAEVGGWITEKLGVDRSVYDLTKVEASKAIDILNNNGSGGAKK